LTAFDATFRKRETDKARQPDVAAAPSKRDNAPDKQTRFRRRAKSRRKSRRGFVEERKVAEKKNAAPIRVRVGVAFGVSCGS
jgi:hypothetical protein